MGDEVVVDFLKMDQQPRKGEILEVIGSDHGCRYRVRWDDDGHESVFIPGPTTHLVHLHRAPN